MSVHDDYFSRPPAVGVQTALEEGLYVYCFADARKIASNDQPFCHDDGVAVWSFAVGEVAALVRVVALADFCDETAESRLGDLAWVGPRACRHEAVVERAMQVSPVFPAGFGTLFRSYDGLRASLRRHQVPIRDFLDRAAGKREWAIKAYAIKVRPEAMAAMEAERCPELSAQSPGIQYLQRRQMQPALAAALLADAVAGAGRVAERLTGFVSETRTLTAPPAVIPAGRLFVGSFAFLVEDYLAETFRGEVHRLSDELSRRGLELALSGPWPPFSFLPALDAPSATRR